ncbi:hypothetical protein MNEG_0289 [Monoraphidium neglectum]|uniref:Uncharacterized protein n=1 Tax=Monoraphidium neglectum TaxID=145388 RepID=A0A0D2MZ37_9CHLO|nr:hypothetical protein MNEG_0289 [Monoraphidium neglectum]KIZ07650.1 hypothetical protein MNEG_0289 [Monoraphidium neglectum]|eukprot:XP_013906669.1 hypothetical protein MNEG_0289 [Monoraphidium neglectum]
MAGFVTAVGDTVRPLPASLAAQGGCPDLLVDYLLEVFEEGDAKAVDTSRLAPDVDAPGEGLPDEAAAAGAARSDGAASSGEDGARMASPEAAEALFADLAEVEETALPAAEEWGWLGRLMRPAAAGGGAGAEAAAAGGFGGGVVVCGDCRRIVLSARTAVHAQRCLARRQLAERQQQALQLRAQQQQRPSTPPMSNMSKPAGSGRGGAKGHHAKGGAKRPASTLGPYRAAPPPSALGVDGRPPLPRAAALRAQPGTGWLVPASPLMFGRGAAPPLDSELSPPQRGGGARGGGAPGGAGELGGGGPHPALLAAHTRRRRSETPVRRDCTSSNNSSSSNSSRRAV